MLPEPPEGDYCEVGQKCKKCKTLKKALREAAEDLNDGREKDILDQMDAVQMHVTGIGFMEEVRKNADIKFQAIKAVNKYYQALNGGVEEYDEERITAISYIHQNGPSYAKDCSRIYRDFLQNTQPSRKRKR